MLLMLASPFKQSLVSSKTENAQDPYQNASLFLCHRQMAFQVHVKIKMDTIYVLNISLLVLL